MPKRPERTFVRGEKVQATSNPAAATQLIAEGWTEVEVPTDRPEPDDDGDRFVATPPGRRRRRHADEQAAPTTPTPEFE